ncbi:MAG: hypothetical protein LYZ69_09335 [Nitrososphaerales archaeon]|nr:hypothetical protein [Nitrososphaerales archaeon]
MGVVYVAISIGMAIFITVSFGVGARAGSVISNSGQAFDLGSVFGLMLVPFFAIFGLIITTPTYLLFVNDKNAGVLEYLLATGMSQRDVFKGYLKAALMLSLLPMVPAVLISVVLSAFGPPYALGVGALAVVMGLADVALVTFLMTGFSAMQRKPTGMNSPVGITIGVFLVLPEFLLLFLLQGAIIWLDLGIAAALMVTTAVLLSSVDRLIMREKLLP